MSSQWLPMPTASFTPLLPPPSHPFLAVALKALAIVERTSPEKKSHTVSRFTTPGATCPYDGYSSAYRCHNRLDMRWGEGTEACNHASEATGCTYDASKDK